MGGEKNNKASSNVFAYFLPFLLFATSLLDLVGNIQFECPLCASSQPSDFYLSSAASLPAENLLFVVIQY